MEQLPSTAVGVLDMFATSRTGIDIFSDQIIESVKAGETSPLKVRVWIKTLEEILERVKKETSENQLTEASKWSEKSFDFAGATITKAEHGTKYDFSKCGDSFYNELVSQLDVLSAKIKKRETWLKSIEGTENVIDEHGEINTVKPPTKTSTSGLNVTIK